MSHYNESHPDAIWSNFFVVSRLLPNGSRRSLARATTLTDDQGRAKIWTKAGIMGEEEDGEWFDFTTGEMKRVLEKEFGFKFDRC